jgi:hypothetical protein
MHLIFFASYLHRDGHASYESIAHYCSAVRTWCRQHGRRDPGLLVLDGFTQQTPDPTYYTHMRAIKRALCGTTNKRKPLALHELDVVLNTLRSGFATTPNQTLNLNAAILHAFGMLLRISEYTTTTKTNHKYSITASRGDITFFPSLANPDGYRFCVRKSKQDQFRTTITLTVYAQPTAHLCPVRAMAQLFQRDPQPATAPLFNFGPDRAHGQTKPDPSRGTYTRLFKLLLTLSGLPINELKPHSLRSGGATALLQAGVSPYIIQKMGRWASWCFALYTEISTTLLRDAAILLSQAPRHAQPVDLRSIRQD